MAGIPCSYVKFFMRDAQQVKQREISNIYLGSCVCQEFPYFDFPWFKSFNAPFWPEFLYLT